MGIKLAFHNVVHIFEQMSQHKHLQKEQPNYTPNTSSPFTLMTHTLISSQQ